MYIETGSRLTKVIYFLNTRKFVLFRYFRYLLHIVLHLEIKPEFFEGGLKLIHPYNIIIHPKSVLGQRLTIYNNVTIGSVDRGEITNTPVIGDGVVIYPYSLIAGDITIGDNVIIQAGSIVLQSVPGNCLVAGNPARVVKTLNSHVSC